ncbi:MAG: VCBS repeat-containing protein, partial [Rhodothermales bacterium]|nr:VCBS repeat-containing protein [Rhodothermales bacterium]
MEPLGTAASITSLAKAPYRALNMRYWLIILLAMGPSVATGQPYLEVSARSGIDVVLRASGIATADIDLDGDLDLYTVSPEERDESDPTTWNHLLRNRGDGTFEDITVGSGIEPFDGGYRRGQQGNRFGVSWGDFDGDRF